MRADMVDRADQLAQHVSVLGDDDGAPDEPTEAGRS
jgi:hypothetical protein